MTPDVSKKYDKKRKNRDEKDHQPGKLMQKILG